jgi:hypothetical protein
MNAIHLRAIAAEYLRYKRHCPIVAFERSHWPGTARPDVLGITKKQHIIEIEIKCSYSDFRANSKKRGQELRERCGLYLPHYYYFLVPPELVERIKPELSDNAGLMSVVEYASKWSGLPELIVHVPAKKHPMATIPNMRDLVALVMAQSGTLCQLSREIAKAIPA